MHGNDIEPKMLTEGTVPTVGQGITLCWGLFGEPLGVEEFVVMGKTFDLSISEEEKLPVIPVSNELGIVWLPTECLFVRGCCLRYYNEETAFYFGGDRSVLGVEINNPVLLPDC